MKETNILDKMAGQLKGEIYDELTKKTQWRVTVYSGNPNTDNWKRCYLVPSITIGYILRKALCEELQGFGVFDKEFVIVHVECFNPNTPEDGWYEWYSENGDDCDLFEVDENFRMLLKSEWAD